MWGLSMWEKRGDKVNRVKVNLLVHGIKGIWIFFAYVLQLLIKFGIISK